MIESEQTRRENTAPAPPPIPEFRLREIELDEGGYTVEPPHQYYGVDEPLWKAIGEGGDLIFRASSEDEAREKVIRVLEHGSSESNRLSVVSYQSEQRKNPLWYADARQSYPHSRV